MNWLLRHKYKIAGSLAALSLLIFVFGKTIARNVFLYLITPSGSYEEYARPSAPDYSHASAWAALPTRNDKADVSPIGLDLDQQSSAGADVFYIHPTTYINSANWNQPLDDEDANQLIEDIVLPTQAGAFNGCCKVYVPRYRQATIASFLDTKGNGEKALQLAYEDVANAFEYFLKNYNKGRPFILAGHSQGARHAAKLLKNNISDQLISSQLIAAYTIGQPLMPTEKLPVCVEPAQTKCQIGWNSQTRDAEISVGREGAICVNPISWRADSDHAPASQNRGSVDFEAGGKLEQNVADAQCDGGLLILTEINSGNFTSMPFGKGNYHRYEFSLYYMGIRENAELRTEAFGQ